MSDDAREAPPARADDPVAVPVEASAHDDPLAVVLGRSVVRRGAILQRKVGFEWEMGSIRPWLVRNGTIPELVESMELADEEAEDGEPAPDNSPAAKLHRLQELIEGWNEDQVPRGLLLVRPVARKQVLHQSANPDWRLEADDTPGPWRSNIEYVTEPFEETPDGLARFHRACDEIAALVSRLQPAAKMRGPGRGPEGDDTYEQKNIQDLKPHVAGGPYQRVLRGDESRDALFFGTARHNLTGSPDVPRDDLAFSGTGGAGVGAKMQATIGIDLGAMTQVMGVFGASGPTLGDQPGSLAAAKAGENPLYQHVSRAPTIAVEIAGRLEDAGALPGPRPEVEGLLATIVLAVLALGSEAAEQLKYRFVLMPRTSHVALLESLPGAEGLRGRGAWLTRLVVEAIGNPSITADAPLMRGVADTGALTVQRWIAGIVDERVDYLLPASLAALLEAGGVDEGRRKVVTDRLESFCTVAAGDLRDGRRLAVYEHRGIDPPGTSLPSIEAVRERGDMILRYMIELRSRRYDSDRVDWPEPQRVQ